MNNTEVILGKWTCNWRQWWGRGVNIKHNLKTYEICFLTFAFQKGLWNIHSMLFHFYLITLLFVIYRNAWSNKSQLQPYIVIEQKQVLIRFVPILSLRHSNRKTIYYYLKCYLLLITTRYSITSLSQLCHIKLKINNSDSFTSKKSIRVLFGNALILSVLYLAKLAVEKYSLPAAVNKCEQLHPS